MASGPNCAIMTWLTLQFEKWGWPSLLSALMAIVAALLTWRGLAEARRNRRADLRGIQIVTHRVLSIYLSELGFFCAT